jgi:ubiquinone/menaquinone biosynthesis C-methylase UbiE
MDPAVQDRLLDLLINIVGIIAGSGIVIVIVQWLRHRGLNRSNSLFVKAILQAMTLEGGSRVLDVGCGTGWASREAARLTSDGNVVGIDISHHALKQALELTSLDESHSYANLVYATADAAHIPCPTDCFDYATCSVSFSWFSDPGAALAEMERNLKPGGKLCLADVCRDHILSRVVTTLSNCLSPCMESLYSAEEYQEFVESRFLDVHQKRLGPLGGLLTVGTKRAITGGGGK